MKGEKGKLYFIYALIIIIIILIIALTYVVLTNSEKPQSNNDNHEVPKVDVSVYPEVSETCTFNITLSEYNSLTTPGCQGEYTRYNITDIDLNGTNNQVTIIYNDQNQNKVGLYVNDERIISNIEALTNVRLGIFDNKLFILDNNQSASNLLMINDNGQKIYDLKETLEAEEIADPAFTQNGNTDSITVEDIDPNSWNFSNDVTTFNTTSNACTLGSSVSGTTYQITYNGETVLAPAAVSMVNCE